jgi:WD40 repeat protein
MDHTMRLYDMNNMKAKISYRAHVDSVNSINFGYKSNFFVSGSADKTLSLWDMRTYICTQTYYGHNNSVNSAVINCDGYTIASCDSDGIVKLWDNRMNKELYLIFDIVYLSMNVKKVLMCCAMI